MRRRTFIKRTFATALTLGAGGRVARAASDLGGPGKFVLSAPLTHSDWMLKSKIPWGSAGVRHMLDACKECGWSHIYWRAFDGGRALYHSRYLRPMGRWDDDSFWSPQTDPDRALVRRFTANLSDEQRAALLRKFDALDYATFDPLQEAVEYGHKIGLHIHAWLSINEDDHGWGLRSEFSKRYPEFRWRRGDGRYYHSQLSFAFPEVRQYKLNLIREIIERYAVDGLFLDWIRTGDVRDNPQGDASGIADFGFETPNLQRFWAISDKGHELHPQSPKGAELFPHKFPEPSWPKNDDPAWVACRAEPQTDFMRSVRRLTNRHRRGFPLAVLVGHPWHYRGEVDRIDGNLRGLLLDLGAWAREGLVDAVVPAGYYRDGGNLEMALGAVREETLGKVPLWAYAWVPQNPAEFDEACRVAERANIDHILFWEADYIDDRANATELKAAMRARAVEG